MSDRGELSSAGTCHVDNPDFAPDTYRIEQSLVSKVPARKEGMYQPAQRGEKSTLVQFKRIHR